MKTLTVQDLARTEQLDRPALSAVRGGTKMSSPYYNFGNATYAPRYDASVHATQDLAQFQNVVNATANGSAFIDGVHANNNTSLFGQNNLVAGS
jgi:hypothetical protein